MQLRLQSDEAANNRRVTQLRWYQEEAVDKLFDYYSTPRPLDQNGNPVAKNAVLCLPTGTGKSVIIAEFFRRAFALHMSTRAFMLTHVKKLIEQNAKKMLEVWPHAPLGIYSAGLKSRDTVQPLIFGGIQSVVKKIENFGFRDFLVIDEAHLVGDDGSYLKAIEALLKINPFLKVIMLTATPYRLGMGLLTNGPIATDIIYDLCNVEGFARLIAEGFICPPIPKRTKTQLDVRGVGLGSSDFNQKALQVAVDKEPTTLAALAEAVAYGNNPQDYRHCWLIFASGQEHADHIGEMLNNYFGIPTVVIHDGLTDAENDKSLELWQTAQARACVSMNKMTTGLDHPPVDLIIMLRPTASPGLWVQMVGRGTRPYDGRLRAHYIPGFEYIKLNCLVLDFAGNTRRLGPIDNPLIPRQKGEGPPGDAPVKVCETCDSYNPASVRFCVVCGAEFLFKEKLYAEAGNDELLKNDMPLIEMINVDRMVIVPHTTLKGDGSIKIAYYCGIRTYYEQKSVETRSGFYTHRSKNWFRQFYNYAVPVHTVANVDFKDEEWDDVPNNNADILRLAPGFRTPRRIQVWLNAQPKPEVQGYEF